MIFVSDDVICNGAPPDGPAQIRMLTLASPLAGLPADRITGVKSIAQQYRDGAYQIEVIGPTANNHQHGNWL